MSSRNTKHINAIEDLVVIHRFKTQLPWQINNNVYIYSQINLLNKTKPLLYFAEGPQKIVIHKNSYILSYRNASSAMKIQHK